LVGSIDHTSSTTCISSDLFITDSTLPLEIKVPIPLEAHGLHGALSAAA
jgi:hypothetical protein